MSKLSNLLYVRPRASHELSNGVWYGSIGRRGVWQQLGIRWAIFHLGQNLEYRSIYVPQVPDRVKIGATAGLLLVLRAPHTPRARMKQ